MPPRRPGRFIAPARLGVLALLAYLVLDFANPLMPGAVSFEQSVEGLGRARAAVARPDVTILQPLVAAPAAPAPPARPAPVSRADSADPVCACCPRATLPPAPDAPADGD